MENNVTILGKHTAFVGSPDDAKLESFPNRTPGRPYKITLDTHEFSSLCPVTGQPDSCCKLVKRKSPLRMASSTGSTYFRKNLA